MPTTRSNRVGTGFVNLADWSRANSGAASNLANRLAGDVQSQGEAVQGGLNRLGSLYDSAADQGTLRYESPGSDVERADYLSREAYTGPRGLSDVGNRGEYDSLLGRANAAQQAAGRVGDYYGRQAQLQGLYGQTGAYTPGQQGLDSALAGVAGAGRFADLQSRWGSLYNNAQQADTRARADSAERVGESAAAAQRYGQEATAIRERQRRAEAERIDRETAEDLNTDARERRARVGGTCPAPWTPILMADGTEKPAGEVQVGDVVRTAHEESMEWGDYPVVDVSTHEAERWAVTLEDGRELVASYNHRVFVDEDWVEVARLAPGMRIDGVHPGVVSKSQRLGVGTVVLITVEGAHTYQTVGLLSHNAKRNADMWGNMLP